MSSLEHKDLKTTRSNCILKNITNIQLLQTDSFNNFYKIKSCIHVLFATLFFAFTQLNTFNNRLAPLF